MTVNIKDLQHNNSGEDYISGYRIVYFLDNGYDVGEYCSTIEGFMIGFTESDPIMDDDEIPKFISTNDYYIGDVNVIPENTLFTGYVEDVHEPVIGTNSSFKVKITKLTLPDGYEMPVNGYIYSSNGNMIGGEMTSPAAWRKMPHYQSGIGINTTLQVRPGRERQKGQHALILSGEDRLVVLLKDLYITHTLSD